jgi:5-methylcytosine-specific restriction endonuclease McrA
MSTRKKAVEIAKQIAKLRDDFVCQKCGRRKPEVQIQGAHILTEKGHGILAADPDNIVALCSSCHMWATDSWHNSPLENADWFNKKFPGRFERLKAKDIPRPIKEFEWEELIKKLKKELKCLKSQKIGG